MSSALSQFVVKKLKMYFLSVPMLIRGLRLAFSFWSKGNTIELSCTSPQKCSTAVYFFFVFHSFSNSFSPLSAAKLGDTSELESFINMLDQELAGMYLREFYPILLNLFFIRFALKLTNQQAAVCNIGDDTDRVHVAHWWGKKGCVVVGTLFLPCIAPTVYL